MIMKGWLVYNNGTGADINIILKTGNGFTSLRQQLRHMLEASNSTGSATDAAMCKRWLGYDPSDNVWKGYC
ncbi:MAG: hypothetical protein WC757_00305 [Candidatus Paceibacterota bacterium]